MEALGVAASIIQVAAVGLALAQTLYKFCDEASSSKEQVKDLAFYVRSTSLVLEEIGKVFQDENQGSRPMISRNAIATAKEIGEKCTTVFDDLQGIVNSADQSALGVLKFTMKASRLKVLQFGLGEMRSNLQCMMQVIIYARLKVEPRSTFDEPEQRRMIAELVVQHLRAADQYQQAESHQPNDDDANQMASSAESSISQPITNATGNLPTPQSPTNKNGDGISDPTRTFEMRHMSVPDPVTSPMENPQSPGGATNQPKSTSPTKAPATRSVYLNALAIVCCPCFARAKRSASPIPTRRGNDSGGAAVSCVDPSKVMGREEVEFRVELSGESDVDKLVRMWTMLYN